MTRTSSAVFLVGFTFLLAAGAAAQRQRRDPLTPAEIDQIRDTALEPEKRLKLYASFARDRLTLVEQVSSDAKVADKPKAVRERLQDFLDVYDELDDNVDTYADRDDDIRKALKSVIDADTEFQAKLQALKASSKPQQESTYEFLLSNAIDAVNDGAKDHRDLLAEQEELAKKKKLVKPQ